MTQNPVPSCWLSRQTATFHNFITELAKVPKYFFKLSSPHTNSLLAILSRTADRLRLPSENWFVLEDGTLYLTAVEGKLAPANRSSDATRSKWQTQRHSSHC